MIKIISIKGNGEHKQDSKGNACISYQVTVEGGKSAYITSYGGELSAGMSIDVELKEKTSNKSGKTYLQGYWHPKDGTNQTVTKHDPAPKMTNYTPEELEAVMDKCFEYGFRQVEKLKAYGVPLDNLTACVNSLFIAHTNNGHRPNDWIKPVKDENRPDDGFGDPDKLKKESIIADIKGWVDNGDISDSTLTASKTLVTKRGRDEKLSDCSLAELEQIRDKVRPL